MSRKALRDYATESPRCQGGGEAGSQRVGHIALPCQLPPCHCFTLRSRGRQHSFACSAFLPVIVIPQLFYLYTLARLSNIF